MPGISFPHQRLDQLKNASAAPDLGLTEPAHRHGRVSGCVERPEVHKDTRFGYARGREPVAYVRNIRERYAAYVQTNTAGD